MSKKPYSDPRWTQPIGGKVVGHFEVTPEDKQRGHKAFFDFINKNEEKKQHPVE